jgi:hypothetical protein
MGRSMRDQQKEVAFNLRKAEEYRQKAEAAIEPRMKAAFNAVVREYLERARTSALPRKVANERAGSRCQGGRGG